MNQRKLSRYLLWMALIATLVSAYEFCTRVDAMWKPLKMFWNMAVGEKIPLARAATYVDMSIFEIPLYLLCSVALGIWALWARRTRLRAADRSQRGAGCPGLYPAPDAGGQMGARGAPSAHDCAVRAECCARGDTGAGAAAPPARPAPIAA